MLLVLLFGPKSLRQFTSPYYLLSIHYRHPCHPLTFCHIVITVHEPGDFRICQRLVFQISTDSCCLGQDFLTVTRLRLSRVDVRQKCGWVEMGYGADFTRFEFRSRLW